MSWKPIQHCLNVQQRRLDVPIVAYFYTAQRASCYVDVNVTYSCSQYSQYLAHTYVRRPGVCVARDSNYCPYYTTDSTDSIKRRNMDICTMQAHISYWDSFCTPGSVCVARDSNYCPYYTIDSTDSIKRKNMDICTMQAHISYWDTNHSFCTPGSVGKIAEKILHRQTK